MNAPNIAHVNDRLRRERIKRDWRQQDLADQLGTTVVTIKRWEHGRQQPSEYFRSKLCALFDKSAEELGFVSDVAPEEEAIWSMPFSRNPFFTGRSQILKHLHTMLTRQPTRTNATQSYALHGMGGIGKTQLAIEYAYQHRSAYDAVLWIQAETQTTLVSSFIALAELLALPERADEDQRQIVAAVLRWLNQHEGWLLIFDNVEDLSMLKSFLPSNDQGALLLTTRLQTLGTLAQTIPITPMTTQEGVGFLLMRTKRLNWESEQGLGTPSSYNEEAAAHTIVAEMGGLPLAIEQAGAYIDATQCRLSDYVHLFRAAPLHLLSEQEPHADHPLSVSRTFTLAFERVEQHHRRLAADILTICAYLSPEAIPESLFLKEASALSPEFAERQTDPLIFQNAIKVLLSYSLLQRHPETQTLSIHRLVQVVLRQKMSKPDQERWLQRTIRLLSAVFPEENYESTATWKQCERLLPHILTCVAMLPEHYEDLELASLLQKAATYLYERGQQREQAEELCQRALHIRQQILGPEHPTVAASLYKLGCFYRYMGRFEEAGPLYEQARSIYEKAFGSGHLEVAKVLSELARLAWTQGKYTEAELLFEKLLHIWEQAFGPEHPQVARDLNGLAATYQAQGRYAEAQPLYERSRHIYEVTLGPEHPDGVVPLHNLADLLQAQGRNAEAQPLYEQVSRIWEQALGPEHPNMAVVFYNLAGIFHAQKKYEKARLLYEKTLHIWEQSGGPTHVNVAIALNGLANLSRDQGRYKQAKQFYQRALTIRQLRLDPQHPEIADTLHDLAHFHQLQQQTMEALSLYQQALSIREQVYGSQHPKTQNTHKAIAQLHQETSQTQEATTKET